jgi:hypothetical protein
MVTQLVLSSVLILGAWTVLDLLLHRLLLQPFYAQNPALWRPFDQLNVILIYAATFTIIAVFVTLYSLFIAPKSFGTGISFGACVGLALGVASGGGTYIHIPIPRALAWGWLLGGCLRGITAGAILGALIS